jgi:1,5-anhydro-D-fructose reductase (1,5-anhydro-D-mannitol-forming)
MDQSQGVGWGLIGASNIAREWVIPAIRNAGGTPLAIMSRDQDRARIFAEKEGIERATTSLNELLDVPGVGAVYISTTNERHYEEALAAARRGKHVLCEKPLALELAQAVEMVNACESRGLVFATNHHLRNSASHRAIKQLVQSGAIGSVHAMSINHAVFLPLHLQTWRVHEPASGGGIFLDISVHDGDTARFILSDEPLDVVAQAGCFGMGRDGLEDAVMFVLRMQHGTLVQVHESFVTKYGVTALEIHGSEGSILARDVMTQRPTGTVVVRSATAEREIPIEHEDLYSRAIRHFHAAIAGAGKPVATGRDGIRSLAVALAVTKAARTGGLVTVSSAGLM